MNCSEKEKWILSCRFPIMDAVSQNWLSLEEMEELSNRMLQAIDVTLEKRYLDSYGELSSALSP